MIILHKVLNIHTLTGLCFLLYMGLAYHYFKPQLNLNTLVLTPTFKYQFLHKNGSSANPKLTKIRQFALDKQDERIMEEIKNYDHQDLNLMIDHMADFIMEKGGKPIRNLIFTTWRSGSTFLGEVVNSHPASFYHFEPHVHLIGSKVPPGSNSSEAVRVVQNLLNCNFSTSSNYLNFGKKYSWLFSRNTRLWKICKNNTQICWNANWQEKMCKKFPFQLLKTVRMSLSSARPLLEDPELNVKIIYLVRDPRGIMTSRVGHSWCEKQADCYDPSILCGDQVENYFEAIKLRRDYPDRFKVVRYEDLCQNVYAGTEKIFKFFRLSLSSLQGKNGLVRNFIQSHTTVTQVASWSTYRETNKTLEKWIQKARQNFTLTTKVQNVCKKSLQLWGYNFIQSYETLNNSNFNPVSNPHWANI